MAAGPVARRRLTAPWVVAWAIFAAYVLAARGVGNFFPLSVFDMYQAWPGNEAARILVVDEAGRADELEAWSSFACEGGAPQLMARVHCGRPEGAIGYVARDQQRYLDAHLGAGGPEHVTIVSRSYRLTPTDGPLPSTDCVIARCAARREASP